MRPDDALLMPLLPRCFSQKHAQYDEFDSGRGHLVVVPLLVESRLWRSDKDAPKGQVEEFWVASGGKVVKCRESQPHAGLCSPNEVIRHLWVCVRGARSLKQELVRFGIFTIKVQIVIHTP
jgi:hypothetical protein